MPSSATHAPKMRTRPGERGGLVLLAVAVALIASVATGESVHADGAPDLALEKFHNFTPNVGSLSLYRIVAVNVSDQPSVGAVTVTDTLPTGLRFFDGVGDQGWAVDTSGSVVTAVYTGVIPPGDSTAFLIEAHVDSLAFPEVTNHATLSGGGDTNPNNDRATDVMTVLGPADFTVTKGHQGSFTVTGTGSFSFEVRNRGSLPTRGVLAVDDTLPNGLAFVSAQGAGWSIGHDGAIVHAARSEPIAAGAASTFSVEVAVGAEAYPSVTNSATISGWADLDVSNNRSTDVVAVVQPTADLVLDKRHTDTFVRGQDGTFRFVVTNRGLAATNASYTVTDTLKPSLSFVGGSGAGWSFTTNGPIVTATRSTVLVPHDSATFTMTVAVSPSAPSTMVNVATVRGGGASVPSGDLDWVQIVSPSGVGRDRSADLRLDPPSPDPVGAAGGTFHFSLPRDERVSLAIFDVAGRLRRVLSSSRANAGEHTVRWDGRDDAGRSLAPGVYVVRLSGDDFIRNRRFVRLN